MNAQQKARMSIKSPQPLAAEAGLTLVELIITVAIVAILASAALPIARFQVKREKERELRRDLWEMRDAIDHYKDAAEKGGMVTKADSMNGTVVGSKSKAAIAISSPVLPAALAAMAQR